MRNNVKLNSGFLVVLAMFGSLSLLVNAYQQYITSSVTIRCYGRIVPSIPEFLPPSSEPVEPPPATGLKPSPIILVDSITIAVLSIIAGCIATICKCRRTRHSTVRVWGPIIGVPTIFIAILCWMAFGAHFIDEKAAIATAIFTIVFRVAFYWATQTSKKE